MLQDAAKRSRNNRDHNLANLRKEKAELDHAMAGLKRKYSEVRETYENLTMSRTYKLQEYDRRVEEFKAAKRQRERMQALTRHDEKELK